MLIHMLLGLVWVDFDLGVPPFSSASQPHSHQPKQNWADGRTTKISQPNPGPRADESPCRSPSDIPSRTRQQADETQYLDGL